MRQRGECLRALAARRVSMCKDAKLSCRGNKMTVHNTRPGESVLDFTSGFLM